MPTRFLIDANLPRNFPFWQGQEFVHEHDLGVNRSDREIWLQAREQRSVIVTKDADFSQLVLVQGPAPSVIHVRLGNLRLRELGRRIEIVWPEAARLSETHCLVQIFTDRIEAIR